VRADVLLLLLLLLRVPHLGCREEGYVLTPLPYVVVDL
jgi:hypothetical protein